MATANIATETSMLFPLGHLGVYVLEYCGYRAIQTFPFCRVTLGAVWKQPSETSAISVLAACLLVSEHRTPTGYPNVRNGICGEDYAF